MRLAPEDVVKGAPADHEVHMAAIGVSLAVAGVRQHLNAVARPAARVGAVERASHDAQHRVPCRHVIDCGDYLRQAKLDMIQIDVSACAVAGKKAPAHILRIPGPLARRGADGGAVCGPRAGSGGSCCPQVAQITVLAGRKALDLSEQRSRGLVAGAARVLHSGDEIAQLNIGAAQLGQGYGSRVLC